jgi:putative endonuclease
MYEYFVYILCSKPRGTLYIGVTNDLSRRIEEHRNKVFSSFTQKYAVNRLVYFESFQYVYDALQREKQLKKWNRVWKIALIEKANPQWRNFYSNPT